MSTEIYYFSGTGNSLHVARELQTRLPDAQLVSILSLKGEESVEAGGEAVGFVFSHYASSLPKVVRAFVKKLDLGSARYLFAIATRGGTKTWAFAELDEILKERGRRLDALGPHLIKLGKRVESSFDFYTDPACTGCGLCERVCLAVGLAAKPVAPKAPLGALLVSATAIDTLWGVFAIAGIETLPGVEPSSIQWSHGLLMAVVWALAGFVLAFLLSRDRRMSSVVGLLIFSHWVLDFVSWPDTLPLLFGGGIAPPLIGLVAGALGSRIHKPLAPERSRLPGGLTRFLAALWPWSLLLYVAWVLGQWVIGHFFNDWLLANGYLIVGLVLGTLLLTPLTAYAHDLQKRRGVSSHQER